MSRRKKSRTLKGKLAIKTGSKKDFYRDDEKGKIPSHNRLAKHKKNRQKSAYQQHLQAEGLTDTSAGRARLRPPLAAAEAVQQADKPKAVRKKERPTRDFDQLDSDELLDLFNS